MDRIDYNVEQSTLKVKSALKSVQKAEKYQKNDKKMHCIVCLSITIIILLILLIIIKSWTRPSQISYSFSKLLKDISIFIKSIVEWFIYKEKKDPIYAIISEVRVVKVFFRSTLIDTIFEWVVFLYENVFNKNI